MFVLGMVDTKVERDVVVRGLCRCFRLWIVLMAFTCCYIAKVSELNTPRTYVHYVR